MVGRSTLTGAGNELYGSMWIDRPPLIVWLFGGADISLGSVGIRMIGVFASIALVCSAAWTVRRMWGSDWEPLGAVLAAPLAMSPALSANISYAELIAAPLVCVCAGLTLPVVARDAPCSDRRAWMIAGVCAGTALMIKQSFIDGVALGCAAALVAAPSRHTLQRVAIFGCGVCLPIVVVVASAVYSGARLNALWYAIAGFRIDASTVLASGVISSGDRLTRLAAGLLASGYVLLIPISCAGVIGIARRNPRQATCHAVWLATSWVGVIGGGYFWTHYMIGPVPVMVVTSVAGIRAIDARLRLHINSTRPIHLLLIGGFLTIHAVSSIVSMHLTGPSQQEPAVSAGRFVREHAHRDDTVFVMYARANAAYYSTLRPAFPFQWSLMYRTLPNMDQRVEHMLRSRHPPTWIIEWNTSTQFNMDRSGDIRKVIAHRYVLAGTPSEVRVLRLRYAARASTPGDTSMRRSRTT